MNRIREIREKLKLSQIELARRTGVSQPFIHDLENGNRNAKPETMQRIAKELDVSVEALKGGQTDGAAS